MFETMKKIGFVGLLFLAFNAMAQIGGERTFMFLNQFSNARINALGGYAISIKEADVNLGLQNPALLNANMNHQAAFNYMRFVDDISSGYFAYAFKLDSNNTLAAGVQYINYGDFTRTTENAEELGTFTAGEYNYHVSYARKLNDNWSVGGALKFINSNLDIYHSMGLAIDAGINYYNPKNLVSLSGVVANFGYQFKPYRPGNHEDLPLNIMLGFSKKFQHNPFRFSIVAHNLQSPLRLTYNNLSRPGLNKDFNTGEVIPERITTIDKIAAHLNVSAEILLGKFMWVGMGYNHLRRYEMKLSERTGTAGFSWGLGMRFKKFQMAYGSAGYHAAYGTNAFSCVLFINQFTKKEAKP